MILKPLPPIDEQDSAPSGNDKAKTGYPLRALERILSDSDYLNDWRMRTEIAHRYYDGDNLTQEMQMQARNYGFRDPRNKNLIARVINSVLGQEEKSRRDPKLEPDDDESAEIADVLNIRLKQAQRETNSASELGSAYAAQVKGGLGWVGVSRRADPFQYPYMVEDIPWREMHWDVRCKKNDLSDATWICRAQWKNLSDVMAIYPEHAENLRMAVNGLATWLDDENTEEVSSETDHNSGTSGTWFRTRRTEWTEGIRDRVRMYEVEYKVPALVVAMKVGNRWIIVDKESPAHIQAIERGIAKIQKVPTQQIRKAIFAGPIRLTDEATTLKRFSKVPFFAFRKDGDRTPYGLIEGMIAPQDDYNESAMRVRWMLQAQQLQMDSDALDTNYNSIADISEQMMRPDMVAITNPNRINRGQPINFTNNFQLKQELFARMQDSHKLVQDVPGVYNASMGNGQPGTSSGIAISSLVEQGIVAMAELNGNKSFSEKVVYELLLDLISQDHAERDMVVQIGSGAGRRSVVMNTVDEKTGQAKNVVKNSSVTLGLGEVPSSPAYQIQQSMQMAEMIRALAGTPFVNMLVPTWVEQTSSFGSDRKRIADEMRKSVGMPSANDKEGANQWQQQQQQAAAMQAQAQTEMLTAKTQETLSSTAQKAAAAKKLEAETVQIQQQTGAPMQALPQPHDMQPQFSEQELIEQALAEAEA